MQVVSFLQMPPPKPSMHFSTIRATRPTHCSSMTWATEYFWGVQITEFFSMKLSPVFFHILRFWPRYLSNINHDRISFRYLISVYRFTYIYILIYLCILIVLCLYIAVYIFTALYVFSFSFISSYNFMYSYSFISSPESESLRRFPLSLNRQDAVNMYGRLEV